MAANSTFIKLKFWFALIVPFIGFIFCVLACYPGFMSPDSLDQYTQAKAGIYTDWHPPFMAWVWNKLLWIKDGPQPLLLLFNLLYWSAVGIIAFKIKRFGVSIIFLLCCFAPPMINFIGVIWKDTFLFSILFFTSAILFWVSDRQLSKVQKVVCFLIVVGLSYVAVLLRHNAASAIVPILSLSIILLLPNIKVFWALCFGLLIASGLFWAGQQTNKLLCKNKSLHPEQQLMIYDLMGISYQAKENLFPDYLKKRITLDTLALRYNYCDGGMYPIFAMHCTTTKITKLDSLKAVWKGAIRRYPKFALTHKFHSFRCLQSESSLLTYSSIHPNEFGFALSDQNIFRTKFKQYTDADTTQKFYVAKDYLIVVIIILSISILLFLKKKSSDLLLPLFIALSGFLYSVSYFPLSPCSDLRYNYWTIGTVIISAFMLLNTLGEKRKTTR